MTNPSMIYLGCSNLLCLYATSTVSRISVSATDTLLLLSGSTGLSGLPMQELLALPTMLCSLPARDSMPMQTTLKRALDP